MPLLQELSWVNMGLSPRHSGIISKATHVFNCWSLTYPPSLPPNHRMWNLHSQFSKWKTLCISRFRQMELSDHSFQYLLHKYHWWPTVFENPSKYTATHSKIWIDLQLGSMIAPPLHFYVLLLCVIKPNLIPKDITYSRPVKNLLDFIIYLNICCCKPKSAGWHNPLMSKSIPQKIRGLSFRHNGTIE